jgi:hypothetical protein
MSTQGQPETFIAEFFQFSGGPPVNVTNLTYEIFNVDTNTTVLGPTNVGINHVGLGVYSWVWAQIPPNQPVGSYVIIWRSTEAQIVVPFSITSSGGGAISSGPCEGWSTPTWTCTLSPEAAAVSGVAVQAAADVLYALTGRHLGLCQLTIRPCRRDCYGGSWPFLQNWWEMGVWPRPVFYSGAWYNLTCGQCTTGCSCSVVSEALMPAPVAEILEVKIDGVILDPSAYRVDNWRLLVRTDGGMWPICNDLSKADTEVGTWSVTLTYGEQVSPLGDMALGELATQFAKLLACDEDCLIGKPVQQLIRQGVTMNFLDPNALFAHGMTGLYLCDLFVSVENPHGLVAPSWVYDVDDPGFRITNT